MLHHCFSPADVRSGNNRDTSIPISEEELLRVRVVFESHRMILMERIHIYS